MFGRFLKRQTRKGLRKILPAPLNKFPGPTPRPHNLIKEIIEDADKIGQERKKTWTDKH